MAYTLRDIPDTMRSYEWTVGAACMDRWLAAGPYAMDLRVKTGDLPPPAPNVDTRLVTMDWVMRFSKATAAYARLAATWSRPERLDKSRAPLLARIDRWVAENGVDASQPFRFGDLHRPVPEVDRTSAINFEVVDSEHSLLVDDFYAAIGKGTLKVAVSGMAERAGEAGWRLRVDATGIYLRDTYDFIGEQSLGSWGPRGFSRLAFLAPEIEVDDRRPESDDQRTHDLFTVGNVDFRRYRGLLGKGGDYVIFSDLRYAPVDPPIEVTV